MKCAIYYGIKNVKVEDRPEPIAGPKDVIVKVQVSCICGTDITEYHIKNLGALQPGREFGHELSGVIVYTGSEVRDMNEGTRVTVNPLLANHGGRRESCMLGSFSQYILVQDAKLNHNVFELPQDLSFEAGALVEPFSVAMHGVNATQLSPNDRLLILGAGPIGQGALAGAKALGVKNITLSDISSFRLQKALEQGASAVHNPAKENLCAFLNKRKEQDPNAGFDAIIDAAGVGHALLDGIHNISANGKISVIALHKIPIELNPMIIMSKALTIRGSMGYDSEFSQVLDFMKNGLADIQPIITHRFPLNEIQWGIEKAASINEAVKVAIEIPA